MGIDKRALKIILLGILAILFVDVTIVKAIQNQAPEVEDKTYQQVLNQFQEIVSGKSDEYSLVVNGIRLLNSNQYDLAQITLERAALVDKDYRDAHVYLGYSYLANNLPEPALKALKHAQKLDPVFPLTHQYMIQAYEALGDTEKAKECYNRFKKLEE